MTPSRTSFLSAMLCYVTPKEHLGLPAQNDVALREVGGVSGDLVGDDAFAHIVLVRQTEVFLRRDITKHGGAEPADHRRADGGGDVVVAGRDIGRERAERVERRLVAP